MTAVRSVSIILTFLECVIEATDRRLNAVAWSCVRAFSSGMNEDGKHERMSGEPECESSEENNEASQLTHFNFTEKKKKKKPNKQKDIKRHNTAYFSSSSNQLWPIIDQYQGDAVTFTFVPPYHY